MDETSPVRSDAAEAAEAWPVLEYGTPEAGSLAAVVRGVGWLLAVTGAAGFATEAVGIIGTLTNGVGSFDWYGVYSITQAAAESLIYLLYGLGGLFCLRRRAAAANVICAGAIVSVLSGLSIWPLYLYLTWIGGNGLIANGVPMSQWVGFGYQVLRVLMTLLLPLLLLYLFTRRLIRDAIGVK